MFIKYENLLKKYQIKVNGILHIGAHDCEELDSYLKGGCPKEKIIWIEGNPEKVKTVKNRDNTIKIYNYLVTDKKGEEIDFKITNNGESSSIYDFGSHSKYYRDVKFVKKVKIKTSTVEEIYTNEKIENNFANFLNIDIQGAELLALKGMGKILKEFDYLYLEVNKEHLYKDCALVDEIDEYVSDFRFKRIETVWYGNHNWGDAFYIKS